MLQITLAQMRRSAGRLAAAGVAIVIGTAFVTATLLAGSAMTRTSYDAVSAQYADADLVLSTTQAADGTGIVVAISDADLAAVGEVPGVVAVQGISSSGAELSGPSGRAWVPVTGRAGDARLEPAEVISGRLPEVAGEIALPDALAAQLGAEPGATLTATRQVWDPAGTDDEPTLLVDPLTVVGLLATPSALLSTGGTAVLDADQWQGWLTQEVGQPQWYEAMVALEPGSDLAAASAAVGAASGATVQTVDEHAADQVAQLTGSTTVLTAVVLAFAAVALLVASLVIANTFQVLVAQRTRTLALLRCVGADRGQLRRSVLLEATLLGAAASAVGVLLGIALVQTALVVLSRTDVPVPTVVDVSATSVLLPLLVGTGVTLLASSAPARAATRVSPLAALAPVTSGHDHAGRGRRWTALAMSGVGAALLTAGVVLASSTSMPFGLAVGMLGGALSFVGVLVGAVFWVPGMISRLGVLVSRGAAGRLAAANAVRNPRRVATTSGALFIGVTLVALMSTGAVSATRTFTTELAGYFPVDVVVETVPLRAEPEPLPGDLVEQVASVDGIAATARLVTSQELTLAANGQLNRLPVSAGEPEELRTVMAAPDGAERLADGTIDLDRWTTDNLGLAVGDLVSVSGPDGTGELEVTSTTSPTPLTSTRTMAALDAGAPAVSLWLRLDAAAGAATVTDIQSLAADQDLPVQVIGLAVERQFFQRVVDTLLAIVVGLLGVAVVIAVVGVANTLSLSVLERRRESATLRAIGLTRNQLRTTLAIEGALVAGVGAVVGSALGVVYGWAGARILLADLSEVALTVPWADLALVVSVALAAGVLASVLPARSAARTPPVHALAVE